MSALHDINTLAADALDEHGWTQGEMEAPDGSLCLVGALRACSPHPGDWLIARAVYQGLDHAEEWNDERGRTKAEVTDWLRAHPVSDAALEATFGPQWEAIVRLIRQAATLTRDQDAALRASWRDATGLDSGAVARTAARAAARAADRDAAMFAVWSVATGDASWAAADALVVADLVGQHGLTQDHIDTLLAPWVSVMGDPRDGLEVGS